MITKSSFKALFGASVLFLAACSSDDENPPIVPAVGELIVIGNEGGFNAVNAEISVFDTETNTLRQNVYADANDGSVLGDVLQDLYVQGDELFLILNNSSKIEVVGGRDLISRRTISGISSPNSMLFLSPTRAYVTDLFASTLYEVNTQTGAITAEIDLPASGSQLVEVGGEVWCTSYFPGQAFVINPANNSLEATVDLRNGASGIVRDNQGNVWALCEGDYFSATTVPSALYRIDAASRQIEEVLEFPEAVSYGAKLKTAPNNETVYFLTASGLFAMPANANALPASPLIPADGRNFYGINVDVATGNLALTDVGNFVAAGSVFFYSANGTLIQELNAGIIPDDVVWLR